MTLVVIAILFGGFFALAYLSRRRFGTLGLALAAGALLANHLTVWLAAQLVYLDVPTGILPERAAANIALTLLPAFVLLMSGPSYTNKHQALLGASLFASMATLLVLPVLAGVLPNDELARTILPAIAANTSIVLPIAIGIAVADAWLTHNLPSRKKKHTD